MPFYLQDDFHRKVAYLLTSAGKQYLITPGPEGLLLMQEGTGSAWEVPRPLGPARDRYCAALDANLTPHLVIAEQGLLYHLAAVGPGEEQPLLFYRDESKQCSRFLMAGDRQGLLHFICLALDRPAERWWLLHHRCTGTAWGEPLVIDTGEGLPGYHGELALDHRDGLHLLYRITGPSRTGLYYRQFDPGSGRWGEAGVISASTPAAGPSLALDQDRNLHLLWSATAENGYRVCYRFKGGPEWKTGGWAPETAISPVTARPPFPFLGHQSGELFISWLEGNILHRYRFSGDQWEWIAPQRFTKPALVRVSAIHPRGGSLLHWFALEDTGESAAGLADALLPVIDSHDPGGDFSRLHRYSGKLIGRIADLTATGEQLQQEVKTKNREMRRFSEQSEKQMRLIRKSLEGKETEIERLQRELARIIESSEQKIEQGRQAREAERKRFLDALEKQRKEHLRLENTLTDREQAIARLESHCRELRLRIEGLREENSALPPPTRIGRSGGLLRRLREQFLTPKKP